MPMIWRVLLGFGRAGGKHVNRVARQEGRKMGKIGEEKKEDIGKTKKCLVIMGRAMLGSQYPR